jgi:hypothetical protein
MSLVFNLLNLQLIYIFLLCYSKAIGNPAMIHHIFHHYYCMSTSKRGWLRQKMHRPQLATMASLRQSSFSPIFNNATRIWVKLLKV